MQMIDFWIVRKGEDRVEAAPEVGDAISEHPDNGKMSLLRWWPRDRSSYCLLLA
jgi:hypothetical protein